MSEVDPAGWSGEPASIADTVHRAGITGAGGAGFPSYVKWQDVEEVDYLLLNHQESEPMFYVDKWIGKEHADRLADSFERFLADTFDVVVVGTKAKYRSDWIEPLESAIPGEVVMPDELPLDIENYDDTVVYAYTADTYQLGMENVLLKMVANTVVGNDLPTEYGWLVQNTETLYNVEQAIVSETPVTTKWVHVDGPDVDHRFLEVPVGTPAAEILEAGGLTDGTVPADQLLAHGGPGWCFEISDDPATLGVTKATNAYLVIDESTARENTFGDIGRINVLDEYDWSASVKERSPSERLEPASVYIPLLTNENLEGIVTPAAPVVSEGDVVETGEVIAEPAGEISNFHHASIDGTVAGITDTYIHIRRD